MIKFRDNKIILLGDTHSTSVTHDIISTRVPDGEDVVHLGDVGLGFGKPSYAIDNALSWLDKLNKLCQKTNVNLYLIRGNHDNPSIRIWDSKWSNVFLIKYNLYGEFPNGNKALLLGGAISIDRCIRKPNIDYWYDEGTIPIENVEECNTVFSHDCPEEFNHSSTTIKTHWKSLDKADPELSDDCFKQRYLITDIVKRSKAKQIFYGHFHNNSTQEINGVYGRCVDINELFFFDADKEYKI